MKINLKSVYKCCDRPVTFRKSKFSEISALLRNEIFGKNSPKRNNLSPNIFPNANEKISSRNKMPV